MRLSVFDAARAFGDRPALLFGSQVLSFRERAHAAARALSAITSAVDFRKGRGPIAVLATPTLDTVSILDAAMAVGCPFLPVHPRLTSHELGLILEGAGCTELLVPDALSLETKLEAPEPQPVLDPSRTLAIPFTSGTTGQPRGVSLSHRAFLASAAASARNLGWFPEDRWLLCLPLAHVGGLSILTRCLLAGVTAVLASPTVARDPMDLRDAIDKNGITLVSLVPTQLDRLLARVPAWHPPASLRAVLLGGAPAPPVLLRRASERGVPVLATYGLTESCSQVTTQRPGTVNLGDAGAGPPLPGVELRLEGERILLRSDCLMDDYFPPERHESPWRDGGWLDTGDSGWVDSDGNLHVLGRGTDLILVGGENVHPTEVEYCLLDHPGILEACAFGVEDPDRGQTVAAALVLSQEVPLDAVALARHLEERLASFKRPRFFARLAALPRGPTGKLDRAATALLARDLLTSAGAPPPSARPG